MFYIEALIIFVHAAEGGMNVRGITLFDYNYRQPHHSLRVCLAGRSMKDVSKKSYRPCTPRMKMGLTTAPLTGNSYLSFQLPI